MIGNENDARAALNSRAGSDVWLASGSTRDVYFIGGIIYKVNRCGDDVNAEEYDNIVRKRESLRPGVYFPETSLFTIDGQSVIAMEHITGQIIGECWCQPGESHDTTCITETEDALLDGLCDDTGGDNVIRGDNGDLYIIDAA